MLRDQPSSSCGDRGPHGIAVGLRFSSCACEPQTEVEQRAQWLAWFNNLRRFRACAIRRPPLLQVAATGYRSGREFLVQAVLAPPPRVASSARAGQYSAARTASGQGLLRMRDVLTITYDDGATEQWRVLSAMTFGIIEDSPIPGTLRCP